MNGAQILAVGGTTASVFTMIGGLSGMPVLVDALGPVLARRIDPAYKPAGDVVIEGPTK